MRPARSLLVGLIALAAASCTTAVGGSAGPAGPVASSTSADSRGPAQITEPSSGVGGVAPASPPAAGGPAGPVPSGLERYYQQQLAWSSCASYALSADDAATYANTRLSCARLTVPLAYDQPSGQTITVAVMRKASTGGAGRRIGSAAMDPGGPGGSGLEFLAGLNANRSGANLNTRFDLVGFDPRGVGSSVPAVTCQTPAQRDAYRLIDERSATAAQVSAFNAAVKARVEDCVRHTGSAQGIDGKTFLANVGTRDVAKDLDVLRGVLGDAKLTYIGFSYGTRIGYVYAEQFPANVRAMILDGVEAPDLDPNQDNINQDRAFQTAFESFASWCAQQDQSCALGSDPAQATARFRALIHPLLAAPLALSDGRRMSWTDATIGALFVMYYDSLWPTFDQALRELAAGKGDTLMALADEYYERDSKGHYSNLLEVLDAVDCIEGPRVTDPAAATTLNREAAAAAPFEATGDPPGANLTPCAYWPVPPTYTPHQLSIPNLATTPLVISTKGDPATPYADGVAVAKELKAGLLTVAGTRHTAYLGQGIACADEIGDAYLIDLTQPPAGANC